MSKCTQRKVNANKFYQIFVWEHTAFIRIQILILIQKVMVAVAKSMAISFH